MMRNRQTGEYSLSAGFLRGRREFRQLPQNIRKVLKNRQHPTFFAFTFLNDSAKMIPSENKINIKEEKPCSYEDGIFLQKTRRIL